MASNKFVYLRKVENFVKVYPEDISKDKSKRANFRKSCKNVKIVDGYLTYKGKRRVTFGNDRKLLIPQHQSFYCNPIRRLNCKQSKPFRCFNITILLFVISQKKATPRSIYFLGNYDWGVDISLQINTE